MRKSVVMSIVPIVRMLICSTGFDLDNSQLVALTYIGSNHYSYIKTLSVWMGLIGVCNLSLTTNKSKFKSSVGIRLNSSNKTPECGTIFFLPKSKINVVTLKRQRKC